MNEAQALDLWLWKQLGNSNAKIGKESAWQRLNALRLQRRLADRFYKTKGYQHANKTKRLATGLKMKEWN